MIDEKKITEAVNAYIGYAKEIDGGATSTTYCRKEVRNEQKKADRINHKLVEVL